MIVVLFLFFTRHACSYIKVVFLNSYCKGSQSENTTSLSILINCSWYIKQNKNIALNVFLLMNYITLTLLCLYCLLLIGLQCYLVAISINKIYMHASPLTYMYLYMSIYTVSNQFCKIYLLLKKNQRYYKKLSFIKKKKIFKIISNLKSHVRYKFLNKMAETINFKSQL